MRSAAQAKLAKNRAAAAWVLSVMALLGCGGPALDVPTAEPGVSLELVPVAPADAVPSVSRARLRGAPAAGEPWLVAGELSSYYARALKRGEVPAALRERALPLRYWQDGADCWLQPLVALQPGQSYTLAFTGVGSVQSLVVAAEAAAPLERLFPAAGRPKHAVSVVCGMPADVPSDDLVLEPGDVPLQQDVQSLAQLAPGCSLLSVAAPLDSVAVAPPEVAEKWLEPSPWLPAATDVAAAPCAHGTLLHGACLEPDDDRVLVTPGGEDQLWLLQQPRKALLVAGAGTRTTLLRDLPPGQATELSGSVLSSSGTREDFALSLQLAPGRRHVVINEVLSNPLGAEASSEWIELVNDASVSAALDGLWLEDSSGHVPLPAGELAPGELALLVAPGFHAAAPDVPVPAGVRLLELPELGERGLSNSGEALLLVGAEGVVSRFPSFNAEHAGVSFARRAPDAADDDPAAFAEHGSPGASPGATNYFDAGD